MKNLLKMEQLCDAILTHTALESWNFEAQPEHPVIVQFRTAVYDACRYKLNQLYSDAQIWARLLASVRRRVAALRQRLRASFRGVERDGIAALLRDDFLPALRNVAIGAEYMAVAHGHDARAAGLALFCRELVLHGDVQAALPRLRPRDIDSALPPCDDADAEPQGARAGSDSPALPVAS
jgi:hypothetical protein